MLVLICLSRRAARILVQLHQLQERLAHEFEQPVEIKLCFEAGYDGFWLGRFLRDRGHDVYVLDASSFLISRRGLRTKTDRVDVAAMTFTLRAYVAGDPSVCRVVEIPTPEVEDAKRLSRERTRLASERTVFDRRHPFPARIIDNIVLIGRGSSKEIRHVELSLEGSGLRFEPGDALGVIPQNDPVAVETLLDALGLTGTAPVCFT